MKIEAEAVPGAMKEALHSPVGFASLISFTFEELQDALVNVSSADIFAQFFKGHFLPALDGMIKLAQGVAGAALHHRARDVAEIACLLRARKHVKNDRFIGAQRTMTPFVRVAS